MLETSIKAKYHGYRELDDVEETSVPNDKVLECLTSCIHVAHANDILEQQENLIHLLITSLSPGFPWTVKISAFLVIRELCSKLHKVLDDSKVTSTHPKMASLVQKLYEWVSRKVVDCLHTVKIAQVHISASDCLLEIFKLYGDLPSVYHTVNVELVDEVLHVYEMEKNGEAKTLLKTCVDVLENLKPRHAQET